MGSNKRQDAYERLVDLATKQGYVTFDDIMNCADERDLPIQDFDWLSSEITTRGIIVYDEPPENTAVVEEEGDYDDYAHGDYDQIYDQIIELDPSLEAFVTQVRNIVPPQWREFRTLIYQAKEGNEHARERIISMHLRVALKVALQYTLTYDLDIADTIDDACIGLINAVNKYDPAIHDAFQSYASMWIRQGIQRQQPVKSLIYYPVHVREPYCASYPLMKKYGLVEDDKPICIEAIKEVLRTEMGFAEKEIDNVVAEATPLESLDKLSEMLCEGGRNTSFSDEGECDEKIKAVIPYGIAHENIDLLFEERELEETIFNCMASLTLRERETLIYRYGLNGGDELTLEQTGNIYGVTRERVRQIEMKALRKMMHPSRSKRLKGFLY